MLLSAAVVCLNVQACKAPEALQVGKQRHTMVTIYAELT
jgi:hypothetical protein